MVCNMRKGHDAAFKARVALESLKEEKTMAQLSCEFGVHANQVHQGRQKLLQEAPTLFSDRRREIDQDNEELVAELYRQIGQLKVEIAWLKKKSHLLLLKKKERGLILIMSGFLSIANVSYLGLARSLYYYELNRDDGYNLVLMNLIDEQFTKPPFYGVPRMTAWLKMQGYEVNHKRVRILMRRMGLEAVYPKPHLSTSNQQNKKYPDLLKNQLVDQTRYSFTLPPWRTLWGSRNRKSLTRIRTASLPACSLPAILNEKGFG